MANYTALGREGDWGATPPVPFWSPPIPTAGAFANLTQYQLGGENAPIAVAQYTPGGAYAGALAEQLPPAAPSPPPANNGAPPVSQYTSPPPVYDSPQYYSPPSGTPPVSLVPFNPTGGGTPFAAPALPPSQPTPGGAPAPEQVTSTATPEAPAWAQGTGGYAIGTGITPQQVVAPNIGGDVSGELSNLTAQLSGETPTLTPYGMRLGGGYQPPGPPSSGGGASGGGSSGAAPKPPQQQQQPVQRQNPISVVLNQLFGQQPTRPLARTTPAPGYVPTVTAGGRTMYIPAAASGMDVSGAGNTPAGGVLSPGGSPGVVNSLFAPSSTNVWLPLLVGGVLLYAATQ